MMLQFFLNPIASNLTDSRGFLEVLHCEHHEFVVVDLGLVGDVVLLFLGGSSRLDFRTQKEGNGKGGTRHSKMERKRVI